MGEFHWLNLRCTAHTGRGRGLTADGGGAGGALLGVQVAEAVEAVDEVVAGCEALAGQLLLAAGADEALPVPRLLTVGHSSSGDWLQG